MSFTYNQGPQASKPWTLSQMSRAAQTAQILGEVSHWISPAKNGVYALYLYSPYAFPNSEYPYQLRVWAYQPSANFYADSQQWIGGIAVDGTISTTEMNNSWRGTLINKNQIMWNDGSIWIRTNVPSQLGTNPYSPAAAYQQAANESAFLNTQYNRAYPNLYKFIPF